MIIVGVEIVLVISYFVVLYDNGLVGVDGLEDGFCDFGIGRM